MKYLVFITLIFSLPVSACEWLTESQRKLNQSLTQVFEASDLISESDTESDSTPSLSSPQPYVSADKESPSCKLRLRKAELCGEGKINYEIYISDSSRKSLGFFPLVIYKDSKFRHQIKINSRRIYFERSFSLDFGKKAESLTIELDRHNKPSRLKIKTYSGWFIFKKDVFSSTCQL